MIQPFLSRTDKSRLDTILQERFQIASLHPFQSEVLSWILRRESVLASVATGAGKSLCYQLPSVLWERGVLVISPLVALMHHQADAMTARNIAAQALTGQLSEAEQARILDEWTRGRLNLLFVAPERLFDARFRSALQRDPPVLLVVDEAHCISEWGYDFRPEYRRIRAFRELVGQPPLLALTATATDRVKADIRWHLTVDGEPFHVVRGDLDRPNIFLAVEMALDTKSQRERVAALARDVDGGVILYAHTRRQVDQWAAYLADQLGEPVSAYHAGLEPAARRLIERQFVQRQVRVVTATTAFGMGIDRADIRRVIHISVPETMDAYYQEIGRAGRDGLPSSAHMVIQPLDIHRRHQRILDDQPDRLWADTMGRRLAGQPLHRAVLWELDDHEIRIPVLLSILEDRGALSVSFSARGPIVTRQVPDMGQHLEAAFHRLTTFWKLRQALFMAMVRYIETVDCRRREIAHYYEEPSHFVEHCCDLCHSGGTARVPERADGQLVEQLRLWRSAEAKKRGVKPYLVLSDRDLVGIAAKKPADMEELSRCRGVGPIRLKNYGVDLLAITTPYANMRAVEPLDQTSAQDRAVWHFRAGTDPVVVAREVGRSAGTVRGYVVQWISDASESEWGPYLAHWFSEADFETMVEMMTKWGTRRLRTLYDAASGRYSFAAWDVARAAFYRRFPELVSEHEFKGVHDR